MWRGTDRSLVHRLLPELPALAAYPTMQRLTQRLLLSAADPGLLVADEKPVPGEDLTTLRIAKLLESGAYREAWKLYAATGEPPYNEKLARLGVLAAFYSGEIPLGCLETKAAQGRFESTEFWAPAIRICDLLITATDKNSDRPVTFAESRIIEEALRNGKFRFKPASLSDLKGLSPLEAAFLTARNQFDFTGLSIGPEDHLPPHVLRLLIDDPSTGSENAFRLRLRAVSQGLLSGYDLADYYAGQAKKKFGQDVKGTSFAGYAAVTGRDRLPYLYRAVTDAGSAEERKTILREALKLADEYGPVALWPFAEFLVQTDPQQFSPTLARAGIQILVLTASDAPDSWVKVALDGTVDIRNSDLLFLYGENLSTDENVNNEIQGAETSDSLHTVETPLSALVSVASEKLDKSIKLHNYAAGYIYEKDMHLTSPSDYVMPLDSLLERLERAESEQRLGEIILLSAAVLRDTPPERLSPEVFGDVIDGLLSVGLIEDARMFANEAIAGLM